MRGAVSVTAGCRKADAGSPIRTARLARAGAEHSCKQLLQSLARLEVKADNAVMKSPHPRLALLFVAAALGGCAVVPAYDYGPEPAPAVTVYTAPPAPLVEYRGLPPAFGYVWIDGYWNWGGVRYVWIPGRWVNPPQGQVWVPRVWQRDGERWHSLGGHWEQHREERRLPPPDWQRREPQPPQYQRPPEPRRWPEPVPEFHRPPRDGMPPQAFPRPALPQPPVQGSVQQAPEFQRRPEGQQVRPGESRPLPPAVRQEPPPRPAEAAPQHRGPDDGRRPNRRWPEDGDQRERRPFQP